MSQVDESRSGSAISIAVPDFPVATIGSGILGFGSRLRKTDPCRSSPKAIISVINFSVSFIEHRRPVGTRELPRMKHSRVMP